MADSNRKSEINLHQNGVIEDSQQKDEITDSQSKTPDWKPWNKETWEQEFETHPVFRTQPFKEGEELPPLIEALRNMKYDPEENTAEELAEAYKHDGNENFKLKKYRWAADNYTKAIEIKCKNNSLNAQLFANRATALYHIGNYKQALENAEESRKLKPDHLKAFQRGAMCCYELQKFDHCIVWCDDGLNVASDDKTLFDLKNKAEEGKKIAERNRRKALLLGARKKKELEAVKNAIKKRGICLADENLSECDRPVHRTIPDSMVHLKDGLLVWPVIFLYPEYGTTDYIREFSEDSSFKDHLDLMFDSANPPDWDPKQEYVAENLQMYFTNDNTLFPFKCTKTLRDILSHKSYIVQGLTPCFIVTVRGSDFEQQYRNRCVVNTACLKMQR